MQKVYVLMTGNRPALVCADPDEAEMLAKNLKAGIYETLLAPMSFEKSLDLLQRIDDRVNWEGGVSDEHLY